MSDLLKLRKAFTVYWDEMNRCLDARAYWALFHVFLCLPDICAALEAADGIARPRQYKKWCDDHMKDPRLPSAERYRMRCKVLHQGRSTTDGPGWRYVGFAFSQPSSAGVVHHMSVSKDGILDVDVGELAKQTKNGVEAWIASLEKNPTEAKARNVTKNLPTLVSVHTSVNIYPPAMGTSEIGYVETRNVTKGG